MLTLLFSCAVTLLIYQGFAKLQATLNKVWLNPMLLTVLTIIAGLLLFDIEYSSYKAASTPFSYLLELAVVILGYPLYQHLHSMKQQWRMIGIILLAGALIAIVSSFILAWFIIAQPDVAVSLSL